MIEPTLISDIEAFAPTLDTVSSELLTHLGKLSEDTLNSQCSTCWAGDHIVAIAGVWPMTDPGYLVAFAFVSKDARSYRLTLTRWAKECIEEVVKRFSPRRLEITTASGNKIHKEWAEVLGFEWEGTMRCYGQNGEDHERMARVWQ